jgi:hypothetical protein
VGEGADVTVTLSKGGQFFPILVTLHVEGLRWRGNLFPHRDLLHTTAVYRLA